MEETLTLGLEDWEAILLCGDSPMARDYHKVYTLGLVNLGFCHAERTTPRQKFA